MKRINMLFSICYMITVIIILSSILPACGFYSNNDLQNLGSDNTQNEESSESDNNEQSAGSNDSEEFINLKAGIVGVWEYSCSVQTLIEFGRSETEYGMSIVSSALNNFIVDAGFTPSDQCTGLKDDRYFINQTQLRNGIVGQKFYFNADNSLSISILFDSDFQVYPAQLDYYYDANFNLVEGKIGEAISIPNELPQYEVFGGYWLTETKENGIILQAYNIILENIKLMNTNRLQLEYLCPGEASKTVLYFSRVV